MAVVSARDEHSESYRPVRSVSFTGLFPGFARPHFLPANLHGLKENTNTMYVQRVVDEQIVAFEPLEQEVLEYIIPFEGSSSPNVRVGDSPVYAYAFGPEDAVVGNRDAVSQAIEQRFDEIAVKEFAACTAAQFAHLVSRLPDVNRRAFRLLTKLNKFSAYQWRDSTIFMTALRDELRSLNISSDSARLHSEKKSKRLEVRLSLTLDRPQDLQRKQIESDCKKLLVRSGLFSSNDLFTLYVESNTGDLALGQLRMIEATELEIALKQAKLFLEEKVFLPALRRRTSQRTVNVIRDTRQWISKFEKIGDLVRYMDRFRPDTRQASLPFMEIKQIRFEDVYAEFIKKFGRFRGFQTTVADFKEGVTYSPFTLSIYTRTYNNRGGGIRPVGRIGKHEAVVINVTLSGGKYANEWLEHGKRLKCYLKAPRKRSESEFEETHEANRSIMKYPNIPVLVFTRSSEEPDFLYNGVFHYTKIDTDNEGRKWFELLKTDEMSEN